MELTPKEQKLVRPYLEIKVRQDGEGKGWVIGVVVGVVISAAAIILIASGVWRDMNLYFLLFIVIGLVLIEQSVDHRDQVRMARILQKYDAVIKQYEQAEDFEQSG
jgi:hypothetical protein